MIGGTTIQIFLSEINVGGSNNTAGSSFVQTNTYFVSKTVDGTFIDSPSTTSAVRLINYN